MIQQITEFFLWKDADSGAWRQGNSSAMKSNGRKFNIDPYITYFGKKGNRHSLKTRYFNILNECKNECKKQKSLIIN